MGLFVGFQQYGDLLDPSQVYCNINVKKNHDLLINHYLFCVAAVLCLVSLLLSFCFADSAGPYIFVLFDEYSGNIPLLIIALGELLGLTYMYGLKIGRAHV